MSLSFSAPALRRKMKGNIVIAWYRFGRSRSDFKGISIKKKGMSAACPYS
jgi:hypothetical protein